MRNRISEMVSLYGINSYDMISSPYLIERRGGCCPPLCLTSLERDIHMYI